MSPPPSPDLSGSAPDGGDWERLQALFHAVLARPPGGRDAFVEAMTVDAPDLRLKLRQLLASDEGPPDGTVGKVVAAAVLDMACDQVQGWVGRRLGPWRIVAHVADGGMGAVYRAERADGSFHQQVAVKVLNPAWCTGEATARFDAERHILARLEHPLICRLLDGGRCDDGVPYLIMEFVDGLPIDSWCRQHEADIGARLRLFVQVCRAVEHAHRNLVIHRDLKPGNILVDHSGRPRLLDFGIAKLVDNGSGLTRTGERLLTPAYASPEQVIGAAVTTASDVYALGVLLFEVLTGRRLHGEPDASPVELARQIVEAQPPRPSQALAAPGALDEDLDNIVLMALRKEPQRRYAGAGALADDIERHLAHRPVLARPDTWGYRSAKFVRRHPVAVPVSALAVLLALGSAAAFTSRLALERDRAVAAEAGAVRAADFVASLLESTRAEEGGTGTVETLLDTAARRVDAELGDDPHVAARVRHALGRAFYSWYRHEPALAQQQAALALLRRVHAKPHRDTARVLTSLGNVTHGLGRVEESLDWARQALAEWQAVGTPAEQAVAEGDLGAALNSVRRLDEAKVHLERAVAGLRAAYPGDHFETAYALETLAYNRHRAGEQQQALAGYQEALAMFRRLGTRLPQVADLLQSLSALHDDMGDIESAERIARETLPLLIELYGSEGRGGAEALHNRLGVIARHRGQTEESLRELDQALALTHLNFGVDHRYAGALWTSRAMTLIDAGRLPEAEQALAEGLRIRAKALAPDSPDHVGSASAQAALALARDRPEDAERVLRPWLTRSLPTAVAAVDVRWWLGLAVARQGRTDEGRAVAATAVEPLPQSHWKRQTLEAQLALPPFAPWPAADAMLPLRRTADALATRLGESAPAVKALRLALKPPL